MSDRSTRRAAEREARKAARHAANLKAADARLEALRNDTARNDSILFPSPLSAAAQVRLKLEHDRSLGFPGPACETPAATVSEAKLAANRENAQKSSGPVTPEGKAKSSLNAVKHGLTGATVMFANADDAKNYARHVADYQQQLQPLGREESALVQSIADIRWRLATIPVLELGVLALGSAEIIDTNPDYWTKPENQTKLVIEVRRRNEKELRNLALQENRLARRRERETAELRTLQAARKAREEETLAAAAKAALLGEHRDPHSTAPIYIPGLGFDFSTDRFESYMRRLKPAQRAILLQEALAEAAETPQTMEAAA